MPFKANFKTRSDYRSRIIQKGAFVDGHEKTPKQLHPSNASGFVIRGMEIMTLMRLSMGFVDPLVLTLRVSLANVAAAAPVVSLVPNPIARFRKMLLYHVPISHAINHFALTTNVQK